MTAVVILNIVFAVFVVGGILMLLGYGIAKDRTMAGRVPRQVPRTASARTAYGRRVRGLDAFDARA
jgi:hypothetical protein